MSTRLKLAFTTVFALGVPASIAGIIAIAAMTGPWSTPTLVCLALGVPAWAASGWALHRMHSTPGGSQ